MAARAGAALRLRSTASGFAQPRRENYTTSWDTIVSSSPNSSVIQRSTLPLVHGPPSGGDSSSRTRSRSSNSGLKILARALIFAQIAQRRRADGVVAFEKLLNPTLTERGALRRLARRMAFRQEKDRLKMP